MLEELGMARFFRPLGGGLAIGVFAVTDACDYNDILVFGLEEEAVAGTGRLAR